MMGAVRIRGVELTTRDVERCIRRLKRDRKGLREARWVAKVVEVKATRA